MIYSDQKRFVFLHNPKTAGTSLRTVLSRFDDSGGFYWGHEYNPRLERIVDKAHLSIAELQCYPEAAERLPSHFVFGFVRNPYDRAYSAFRQHAAIQHERPTDDFEAFLARLSPADIRFDWRLVHLSPQHRFFFLGDKCVADFIGRHERLSRDFLYVNRRVGLDQALPEVNTSGDAASTHALQYLHHYSPAALRRVNELYEEDFHLFGYEMLDAPDLRVDARCPATGYARRVQDGCTPTYDLYAMHYAALAEQLRLAQDGRRCADAAVHERLEEQAQLSARAVRQEELATATVGALRGVALELRALGLEGETPPSRAEEVPAYLEATEGRLRALKATLHERETQIGGLRDTMSWMQRSRSWRLTAPLRRLRALGR